MPEDEPVLNEQLFRHLSNRFSGEVGVANRGSPALFYIDYETSPQHPRVKSEGAEHYYMTCPFCQHHRPTFYVHHLYGHLIKLPNGRRHHLLGAACCYHCQIEKQRGTHEVQRVLQLGVPVDYRMNKADEFLREYIQAVKERRLPNDLPAIELAVKAKKATSSKIPMPPSLRLTNLPKDHFAVQYFEGGGENSRKQPIDVGYLDEMFQVRYVDEYVPVLDESDPVQRAHNAAFERIVFPFYEDGKLKLWQARTCKPGDTRFKYYFPPGSGKALYNIDYARRYSGVVIVEGAPDVWTSGPASLGLCGMTLSLAKCMWVARNWRYVVIALDPKEFRETVVEKDGRSRAGNAHVIKRNLFNAGVALPPVMLRYPDEASDPADLGCDALWQLYEDQLPAPYLKAIQEVSKDPF